jgi:sialate O-acetylesterase
MKLTIKHLIILMGCLVLPGIFLQAQEGGSKIKVACVGNSVTYGYGIKDRKNNCYPAQLQQLLGNSYNVENFGFSGATLLSKGHKPYINTQAYQQALAFHADIVIIDLGLNDTDPRNWPDYRDDFIADYHKLVESFTTSNGTKPKVYICRMTPIFDAHKRFKSGTRDWFWQIQEAIEKVALHTQSSLVDLHTPLYHRPDLFADALHPDAEGTGIIAKTVYSSITGDFGGFILASVFGEHMVLQQKKSIAFFGTANAGDKIRIAFTGISKEGITPADGKWKIIFPAIKAGGPFPLQIFVNDSLQIDWNDIMVGEVWLCAGQSNMEFQLYRSQFGMEETSRANNPNLRLSNFRPIAQTTDVSWDSITLNKVNQLDYFKNKWTNSDSANARNFSAIGYYFGKELCKRLGVPVGIIEVSVGGAPTEAFIDRRSLEFNPELVDVMNNWAENDFVMEWVRNRAIKNISASNKTTQRHPFMPAYIFEAGISRLQGLSIQGVFWYQGESNANNIEHHEVAFKELVHSLRKTFNNQNLPFYFAQLSSIQRPSWPYFRDSQRKLAHEIPNTGMVVTSDLGDSLDVHPIRKMEVGNRFASLALNRVYEKKVICDGPEPLKAYIKDNQLIIDFVNTRKLSTIDGLPVCELEISRSDGLYIPVEGTISGNKIMINIKNQKPIHVRYGWKPYSCGNLVNEAGLPASTFLIGIK